MKAIFSGCYRLLAVATLVVCGWALLTIPSLPWAGVLVMACAPLAQWLFPYDALSAAHHKVRLPRVSLAVLGGMAWVLLTASGEMSLWLALANLGGFLLDTYWASDR